MSFPSTNVREVSALAIAAGVVVVLGASMALVVIILVARATRAILPAPIEPRAAWARALWRKTE